MFWKYWDFWRPAIFALAICFILIVLLCIYWLRIFKDDTPTVKKSINLNAEALRSPTNAGVTVAALLIPLLLSFISYCIASLNLDFKTISYIGASLLLCTLSLLWGLWNIFSLMGITDSTGIIPVTKANNTFIPAQIVAPLSILFSAFVVVLFFDFTSIIGHKQNQLPVERQTSGVYISKERLNIGISETTLIELWGKPINQEKKDSINIYFYETSDSKFELKFTQNHLNQINEKAK